MKKLWMMVFVVFLVACSSGETAKESVPEQAAQESSTSSVETAQQEVPVETQVVAPVAESSGMPVDFESMILSGAKCVSSKDGQTATVYFKGGKVRMDASPVDAHAIYDDDMMYAWTGTQGTKMSRKDLEQMAKQAGQPIKSQDQVKSEMQDPGVNCEAASVSSDLFVPPSNVEFVDLAQLMNQQYGTTLPQMQ